MNHGDAAVTFLHFVTTGKVYEAFELTVVPNFKHHNPFHKGDARSLEKGMADAAVQFPRMKLEVLRAVQEGDLVAVHSKLTLKPRELEMSVVHLFRFEGDRIAELWDIGQAVPTGSPNENGMF